VPLGRCGAQTSGRLKPHDEDATSPRHSARVSPDRIVDPVKRDQRSGPSARGGDRALLTEGAAVEGVPATLTPTPAVPPRPPKTLTLRVPPGVTPARANAQMTMRGLAHNARLIEDYSGPLFGAVDDLTDTVAALEDTVAAVQRGELGDAEALLMAQAVTLNTIFARCAVVASRNLEGQHIEGTERYLRLALKAQSQCRTTIETLAILKNPTTIFARQANIAQGPQQVNNTQVNTMAEPVTVRDVHRTTARSAGTQNGVPTAQPMRPRSSRARAEKGPSKLLP
jgi:hypothetical protein